MKERVCIVTGGGQGLGRAFANHFAKIGTTVVIAEVNHENGVKTASEINETGGLALAIETDISDSSAVKAMVKQTVDQFGRIDILINNAAILSTIEKSSVDQISDSEWDRVMGVNVTGAFYCIRAVTPIMQKANWGRIINLSSDTVLLPPAVTYAHYITSKAALVGMTRAVARELGSNGITVNTIMPGSTETEIDRGQEFQQYRLEKIIPRQSIPRSENPDDLVGVAAFLASDAAKFVTGQSLPVNGGIAFV